MISFLLLLICIYLTSFCLAFDCDYTSLHSRRYAAYHLHDQRLEIDGKLDEKAWEQVPWSEDFMDIQGEEFWSQPWFETKFKMRYDDSFLYVAAYLEETSIWATLSERNSVIFKDNDFEVFVDPDASTHFYKEFEINVLNTTWNLLLNKPYRDGGSENSTRIDKKYGFDMYGKGMQSGVYTKGEPNKPEQQLHFWTLEIALPLDQLVLYTKATAPPKPNSFWRINFSRVEWLTQVIDNKYEKIPDLAEENWVWSPQGEIAMHMPEKWGYVHFRTELPSSKPIDLPFDPHWNVRFISFQFYYAQALYFQKHKQYTSNLEDLADFFVDPKVHDVMACINLKDIQLSTSKKTYTASITSKTDDQWVASIQHDSLIYVMQTQTTETIPVAEAAVPSVVATIA